MKKVLIFLICITVLSVVFLASCGENNVSTEPENTFATRPSASGTSNEETGKTETENGANDTYATDSSAVGGILPEPVFEDPVAPENYSDHSAQLLSLGFSEGSAEYALYDVLFDVSSKIAYYDRLFEGYPVETNRYKAKTNYYKYNFQSLKEKTDALLSGYNVAYPSKAILPPEIELPESGDIGSEELKIFEQKCKERYDAEAATVEEIVGELAGLFHSSVLSKCAESEELTRLTDDTLEKINFIKPYIEDPLRDEYVDIREEYDAGLDMVRLTVITTGDIHINLWNALFSDCNVESYTENEDGTTTVTALISSRDAFHSGVWYYYKDASLSRITIENHLGLLGEIKYHFQYPYYESLGIDWDAPVRVKSEQLHEALSLFFLDLKGTEEYTMRDLSMITTLRIRNEDTYGQIWLYFSGSHTEFMYPEYFEKAERNLKGVVLLPDSQYYTVNGGRIEELSEEDLAMFVNLTKYEVI